MADAPTSPQAPAASGAAHAKKTPGAQKKTKNPRSKPSHPPTSEMVNNAIKNLKERGGSSLQAIKKYVSANYKVDAEKLSPFIKKYLKAAVASGGLVQTKGKGASGSFKLSSGTAASKQSGSAEKASAAKPKPAKKAGGGAGRPKGSGKKGAAAGKAKAAERKAPAAAASASKAKKPSSEKKAAKSPKSPSKVKRTNKGPTKKPKAPKPKRARPSGGASSAKGAKKAAASGTPSKKK